MGKPTKAVNETRTIYAMIEYGPPAIHINWTKIAPNYHYNIKEKLKAAGYTASPESFGILTKYEKQIRKV